MFEYLMPLLLMRSYPGRCSTSRAGWRSAGRSSTAATAACPGASPSRRTTSSTGTATTSTRRSASRARLKRGLADELVVAPYATALAAMLEPAAGRAQPAAPARGGLEGDVRVLRRHRLHARASRRGRRRRRRRTPARGVVVTTYLAHHQGMTLVALANALLGDRMVDAVPRRSARAGDRAAAAGAGAARGARRSSRARSTRSAWPRRAAVPVRRFRSPHTPLPARAVPLERQLRRGRHQRRRRQPASAAASPSRGGAGTPRATRQPVPLPARRPQRRRSGRPTYQPDGARAGRVPRRRSAPRRRPSAAATTTSRRSSRSPSRPKTTSRCGASARHQPERPRTREIERDELRRDRAGAAGRRPRASRVRQALPRDRVPRRQRGAALPAGGRASRTTRRSWAFHVLSLEGRPQGPVEWETDRARFLGRGRGPRRPGGARRARALGHDRRRARPDPQPAPADPAGARRLRCALSFATGIAAADEPAARAARRSTTTRAPPPAPSRWPSPTRRARLRHLGISDRRGAALRAARLARASSPTARSRADRDDRWPATRSGQSGLWPSRHLRRSADRPRARGRRPRRPAARAAGPAGAGVLAPEGARAPTS